MMDTTKDVKPGVPIDPVRHELSLKEKQLKISIVTGSLKFSDLKIETSDDDFGAVGWGGENP